MAIRALNTAIVASLTIGFSFGTIGVGTKQSPQPLKISTHILNNNN